MTSSHLIYIPLVFLVGLAIGFALARQSGNREAGAAQRRVREREDRVAELKERLLRQGEEKGGKEEESSEGGAGADEAPPTNGKSA